MRKFSGDGKDSLTVYKTVKDHRKKERVEWNTTLCDTADALDHIHRCRYAHNVLKSNNVVLERLEVELLHPVVIDYGKSLLSKEKDAPAKLSQLKDSHKDIYTLCLNWLMGAESHQYKVTFTPSLS